MVSRGLDQATTERFQIGYIDASDANRSIAGRISIPYLTPKGPVGIKYRCIGDHNCKEWNHEKYITDPGTKPHLYNAQVLRHTPKVVVVEGEIDAITVEMHGIPAVAYPGASTWKSNGFWRWCFDSVDEVVVVADGDDPGRKAAATVAESLRDSVHGDVRLVHLPDGEDSNSMIRRDSAGYLNRLGF